MWLIVFRIVERYFHDHSHLEISFNNLLYSRNSVKPETFLKSLLGENKSKSPSPILHCIIQLGENIASQGYIEFHTVKIEVPFFDPTYSGRHSH